MPITAVILAGGQGRRMGGQDKGLVMLAGRPMVEYALEALRPQVDALMISANRNQARYGAYGVPVVSDEVGEFFGPLAGMASAMAAAAAGLLLTAPCDSPLIAPDYARRMAEALHARDAEIAVARSDERTQPVFALLRTELRPSLMAYLAAGERKIDRWYARHRLVEVDLGDRPDMFLNVNDPEEQIALERRIRQEASC